MFTVNQTIETTNGKSYTIVSSSRQQGQHTIYVLRDNEGNEIRRHSAQIKEMTGEEKIATGMGGATDDKSRIETMHRNYVERFDKLLNGIAELQTKYGLPTIDTTDIKSTTLEEFTEIKIKAFAKQKQIKAEKDKAAKVEKAKQTCAEQLGLTADEFARALALLQADKAKKAKK